MVTEQPESNEPNIKDGYPPSYFSDRQGNDAKRQESYLKESLWIRSFISRGRLLDIGCSTGEFIESLEWDGETYGMEVSEYAKELASSKGVLFDRDIFTEEDFFDVIFIRGTIQHLESPFHYLWHCYKALRPGGWLIFTATPNANSIYYKLWNTLPFLDPSLNFFVPSDITLSNALRNIGFEIIQVRYPYWSSPYASPVKDHIRFLAKLVGFRTKFPFWRNMMELAVKKPNHDK